LTGTIKFFGGGGVSQSSKVVFEGITWIAKTYNESSGYYYHGLKHTGMVIVCATELGRLASLDSQAIVYLRMAAAWHDAEHRLGPGNNEEESARLVGLSMKKQDWGDNQVEVVQNLIRATVVEKISGVVYQKARSMGQLEKLLADADLGYIGARKSDFIEMSLCFMAEMVKKPVASLTTEERLSGWQGEVEFLAGRCFLTPVAELFMGEKLSQNLALARNMVTELSSK